MLELATVARRRKDDEALPQVNDRLRVGVGETLVEGERAVGDARPVDGVWIDHSSNVPTTGRVSGDGSSNGSAITRIASSGAAPKVVSIATSRASRPRPMSTRPIR